MSLIFGAVRAASGPAPSGTPYVAGAYAFFALVLVIYVGIMATRLMRNQREIQRMNAELDEIEHAGSPDPVAQAGKHGQVA